MAGHVGIVAAGRDGGIVHSGRPWRNKDGRDGGTWQEGRSNIARRSGAGHDQTRMASREGDRTRPAAARGSYGAAGGGKKPRGKKVCGRPRLNEAYASGFDNDHWEGNDDPTANDNGLPPSVNLPRRIREIKI